MRNLLQRTQLLANIAIIAIAILLGGFIVSRYLSKPDLMSAKTGAEPERALSPGTKLVLTGVEWARSKQTLLLVLSTNCRYCSESSPFYQSLAHQKAGRVDLRTIALLPQSVGEAEKYLNEHNISVDEVRQSAPGSVLARGTPTLILVDGAGVVISSWVGKLPVDTPVIETAFAALR